jgi:hypothetical protein
MKLMMAGGDEKRRRLIVDLEPPVFRGEHQMALNLERSVSPSSATATTPSTLLTPMTATATATATTTTTTTTATATTISPRKKAILQFDHLNIDQKRAARKVLSGNPLLLSFIPLELMML